MALQILIRGKYTLFAAVRGSIIFAYAKSWLHSYHNHETRQQILSIQVKAMNCLWKTGLVILLFSWVAYGRSILEADVGNQGITETPAESQVGNPSISAFQSGWHENPHYLDSDLPKRS